MNDRMLIRRQTAHPKVRPEVIVQRSHLAAADDTIPSFGKTEAPMPRPFCLNGRHMGGAAVQVINGRCRSQRVTRHRSLRLFFRHCRQAGRKGPCEIEELRHGFGEVSGRDRGERHQQIQDDRA